MDVILENRYLLLSGLGVTIRLFLASAGIVIVLSVIAGLARLAPWRSVRIVATVYVEFCRGVSLYVQLFWLYFALPFLGISLDVWQAAVIGLGAVHGAYGSELVRGAVRSIPAHQYETATALSMSRFQRMRYVIFPQALAALMPLFSNEFILLLKATSVCSLITLAELSFAGHSIVTRTQMPGTIFTALLLSYFVMASLITALMRALERRVGFWREPETIG